MSGSFLLDTNIVIALFGDDNAVKEKLAAAQEIFIPNVVIGELIYGAYKSSRSLENLDRIDELTVSNVILGSDAETARLYGEIKSSLRQKGHPIPENDIWIAAIAIQHELTLVSRDAHFTEVDRLHSERW
ncbi:type II toxin-antitoxin system VapC family toxin [bacterium]|nr:type II toxin-antitoxin system VapC family toxin [bacterium]OIO87089.1 MAG: VapC toxin family PIN domain ribonuclease [Anaerolineae bacterium CG2_30_58_95]PIU90158.1 MAG: VapC toxin family PIN domain ribonuclease [Anaerolineae bacterium CG06_land_8_20_14_3_00_57_67]PIW19952.1 MAG: VapC toxin family PIN domain ribonuclease [Anaerolineae bacterium CG17_big_fil_post_rev_8_21_14_2_50_57_27]PJH75538.1 MAG: VapC toxin family PIN domain ribonuclease [Anaerolineae bacterium CG_4_9_14_0_8_um_filter_5